jgi:hypothetical protein
MNGLISSHSFDELFNQSPVSGHSYKALLKHKQNKLERWSAESIPNLIIGAHLTQGEHLTVQINLLPDSACRGLLTRNALAYCADEGEKTL